jgi:hypothetical protein
MDWLRTLFCLSWKWRKGSAVRMTGARCGFGYEHGESSAPELPPVFPPVDDEWVEFERLVAERAPAEQARIVPGFGGEPEAW